MVLVQLLLPLYNNQGEAFDQSLYGRVRDELVDRFGGLTAYTRAPVKGLWEEAPGNRLRDDLVIYEVMIEHLEEPWWRSYRAILEQRFHQDRLMIRAQDVRML